MLKCCFARGSNFQYFWIFSWDTTGVPCECFIEGTSKLQTSNFIEICYTYRIISASGEENRMMSQLLYSTPININKMVAIIIIMKIVIKLATIIKWHKEKVFRTVWFSKQGKFIKETKERRFSQHYEWFWGRAN